jgi:hypothetical protein
MTFVFRSSPKHLLEPGPAGVVILLQRRGIERKAGRAYTRHVSNMKARVFSIFCGARSAPTALSKVARSGPCAEKALCSDMPPGRKPPALAS